MAARPGDECPYEKPFPAGFRACPAYQPARYVPLDMHYRLLAPVWTCSNLEVRPVPATVNRHYARCRVGDAAARARYVEELQEERISLLRALQEGVAIRMGELGPELWAAKARQLEATPDSRERATATTELRRLAARMIASVEDFLEEHAEELARIGMPLDASRQLVVDLIEQWVAQPEAGAPDITPEALERFPADVRRLLRPEARAG